jgi:hypothetical protein
MECDVILPGRTYRFSILPEIQWQLVLPKHRSICTSLRDVTSQKICILQRTFCKICVGLSGVSVNLHEQRSFVIQFLFPSSTLKTTRPMLFPVTTLKVVLRP